MSGTARSTESILPAEAGPTILVLRVLVGELEINQEAFLKKTVLLGRSPYVDVHLDDPQVSRVHASIRRKGNEIIFTDHSSNGTVVNSTRVDARQLADGDSISIGKFVVMVGIRPDHKLDTRNPAAAGSPGLNEDPTIRRPR